MSARMKRVGRWLRLAAVLLLAGSVTGCDPQVYGSIGVSSGYSSWGGSGPNVGGSISIGGRIM